MITDEGVRNDPASNELYAAVYDELKRLAHRQLRARSGADTLSTTELVHEAFLKLGRRPGGRESRIVGGALRHGNRAGLTLYIRPYSGCMAPRRCGGLSRRRASDYIVG